MKYWLKYFGVKLNHSNLVGGSHVGLDDSY